MLGWDKGLWLSCTAIPRRLVACSHTQWKSQMHLPFQLDVTTRAPCLITFSQYLPMSLMSNLLSSRFSLSTSTKASSHKTWRSRTWQHCSRNAPTRAAVLLRHWRRFPRPSRLTSRAQSLPRVLPSLLWPRRIWHELILHLALMRRQLSVARLP